MQDILGSHQPFDRLVDIDHQGYLKGREPEGFECVERGSSLEQKGWFLQQEGPVKRERSGKFNGGQQFLPFDDTEEIIDTPPADWEHGVGTFDDTTTQLIQRAFDVEPDHLDPWGHKGTDWLIRQPENIPDERLLHRIEDAGLRALFDEDLDLLFGDRRGSLQLNPQESKDSRR